ncbi:Vegetative incompatibility protein HET-E-1 [Colletotrichum orbiculare MAFF 240422]|uniref:Vegetative incompatibility protein HET-E-1 n=1 Tax=Colletotrichum orbiculare (strain 104-T / ATCC 96160 / CBS 514.97 / LARS 414 / MAFF 240422) TaxID=1213857 RepID=A0A484FE50_COLOR|nr:Vegetative incompatibility protein HET-E-1 [Colletotrichum orbiculare MAFF 240422]
MRKLLQKLSRPSKKTGAPGNLTPDQFQSPVQSGDAGGPSNNTSASAVEEDQASIPTNSHEPSPLSPPVTKEREKHGLFLLYPESRSAIGDVDIVAVHGLGGDWEDTWTHAAGKSWLKNFLPSDFPNARIWSFGLGGIVVKQALILAIQRSDYWGSIATSTKGLVFFGVPHRGADKAYWAALVVRIAQFSSLGIRGNNKFVDSLKRNSAEFANISQAFIQPGARLTIRSFYETERMGNSLIVDQDSATIGTNNEIALPIWGDHRQICKFASSDSEQYENVLMALRDMIPGIGGEAASIGREPASRLRLGTDDYESLVDCLKLLDSSLGSYYSENFGEPVLSHKMLITGKEIDKKLWHLLKMNAGKFCKIGVSDERDACLSSLLFTELHARRDRVAYSEENTSNWIWSNPTYQDWLKLDSGFLWIFGKAGSGKSTLGAYLQRSLSRDKDGATLLDFFYSARAGPSERGHVYMLRSVLYQMLHKSAALYPAFQGFYRKSYGRPAPQWTFEDLEQCMYVLQFAKEREMVKGCTYLLVIDGLDESEDNDVSGVPRERALNMLSRLCLPNGNHTFKIIALSRNETVIKRHIPTRHFLDMKDMNKRDIEQIIDADIKRMWQKIRHSADLPNVSSEDHPDVYESDKKHYKLDVIRQRLIDHADGVILWVVLVLRELGALFEDPSCTPTRILKALDQIPENLEDLYEDMFVRLRASPTRSHAKAALLFTWLLFAQSTLKVCEVRDIVAIFNWRISDPSATGRNNLANHRNLQSNDNWQPTKRLLEDLCGGFVEVIPQERLSSGTSPSDYAVKPGDSVQLIHQTAREFLLDPKSELKSTGALGTVDDIRWICVNYLELIFENPLPTSPAHEALEHMVRQLQESPLMGYILRTFPKIMDMQPSTRGKESSLLRQRVVDYANNAEQNRWSSLTWWLLRPWIERLFPTGAYKLEDSTPEELISVLKPDNIKSNLLRLILRTSVVDDEETAATDQGLKIGRI